MPGRNIRSQDFNGLLPQPADRKRTFCSFKPNRGLYKVFIPLVYAHCLYFINFKSELGLYRILLQRLISFLNVLSYHYQVQTLSLTFENSLLLKFGTGISHVLSQDPNKTCPFSRHDKNQAGSKYHPDRQITLMLYCDQWRRQYQNFQGANR